MIEGFARELPEDVMADAITLRPRRDPRNLALCSVSWPRRSGVEKVEFVPPEDDGLFDQLKERYYDELKSGQADRGQAGSCRGGQRAAASGCGPR